MDLPLFTRPVGYIDYSLNKGENLCLVSRSHYYSPQTPKFAINIYPDFRATFAGLGRSLVSLAMLHAKEEGVATMIFHDVTELRFYLALAQTSRISAVEHEDLGLLPLASWAEYVEEDRQGTVSTEVAIDIEIRIKNEATIPPIEIRQRLKI